MVTATFATEEGHHLHDHDARFEAWNKRADAYQGRGAARARRHDDWHYRTVGRVIRGALILISPNTLRGIVDAVEEEVARGFEAIKTVTIDAPRAKVWDALTNPAKVKQYMHGTEMSTDWKVGSPITWQGEWKGRAYVDNNWAPVLLGLKETARG